MNEQVEIHEIKNPEIPDIEKNIPIPPKDRESVTAKQLAELEINDSRLYRELTLRQVQAQAAYVRRKYARKFTIRDTGDGIRVWRVS